MRVVGIDSEWDASSLALAGLASDSVKGPWWEKLRIVLFLMALPAVVVRDERMAKEVEREILGKGERGIVWVGNSHAFVRYAQAFRRGGRMGYMLHAKYGDKVFQVSLHDVAGGDVALGAQGPALTMGRFFERVMAVRGDAPVGFDTSGSPSAPHRAGSSEYYRSQPTVRFGDVAPGYVFLEPREATRPCHWAKGFITRGMFARHKSLYEGKLERALRSAKEADEAFAKSVDEGR